MNVQAKEEKNHQTPTMPASTRPHSIINWVVPDLTFAERLATADAAHQARVAARKKELGDKLEALRKKKQEILARKARIDADIVDQEALLQAYNENKAIKMQELAKQKKELKKERSDLKAEKVTVAENVKILKRIYSGFKEEYEEFKASRETQKSGDGEAAETTVCSD